MPDIWKTLSTLDQGHALLRDFAAAPPLPDGTPAYLFRGERDDYPNTLSTLDRYCVEHGLLSETYEHLDDVADFAQFRPVADWSIHPRLRAAFCQHYGLPTQMFDFTSSPDVALFFAANFPRHKPPAIMGRIGILDVAKARAGHCAIDDLRHFTEARRPRAQHGFGMMLAPFRNGSDIVDLKDPETANSIGLEWLEFGHLPDDQAYLHVLKLDESLLSLEGDAAARLPQDIIDAFVEEHGWMCEDTAKILSRDVPAVNRTAAESFERWCGRPAAVAHTARH